MIVKVLASGSDGNCIFVSNGAVNVLIDCGLPKSRIEKIMLDNGVDPTAIDGIFISHEHKDHSRGLAFADKYKIPVYASEGTLKGLNRLDSGKIIKDGAGAGFDALSTQCLTVLAFNVSHDAFEPLGFTVQDRDKKVSVLMDTGTVTAEMLQAMEHSDIYVFECNHDLDMLEENPKYHDGLKHRIKSDIGHLSNNAAAEALAKLVKGNGERIYLTHMSENNNTQKLAERTVKLALHEKGFLKGKHYFLEVV